MTHLKSLQRFREENGLANLTPRTDVSGTETEVINDTIELLRQNADKLRTILTDAADSGKHDVNVENDLKRLVGLIASLKDGPKEKKKMSDPFNNVVTRPFNGPDGTGSDAGGGGGGD